MAKLTMPMLPTLPCPLRFANVVVAIRGLHDFRLRPRVQKVVPLDGTAKVTPAYTNSKGSHYLAPDDFATIFNINPLSHFRD